MILPTIALFFVVASIIALMIFSINKLSEV